MAAVHEPKNDHTVATAEAGLRLDRWLRRRLPDVGLGGIFRFLRQGVVRVDGAKAKPSLRLVPGMVITLPDGAPSPGVAASAKPEPRSALRPTVLLRDPHVWAIDKPPGVPVHGGTGHDDHVERWVRTVLAPKLGPAVGGSHFRPAPAHRLDVETSGVLLIGATPEGQRGLAAAFRQDAITKTYLALVSGRPDAESGVIEAPLRRVEARRGDRPKVVVDPGGRMCRTAWRALGPSERFSQGAGTVLEVQLFGGFMHQIRAHLAHAGHPLLGDARYGGGAGSFHLHAWRIGLAHPVTAAPVEVEAPPPPVLAEHVR